MKKTNEKPDVSIIVVNHNGKNFLGECFSSLYKLDYPKEKMETIMVDNCSNDNSARFIKKNFPKTTVLKNRVNNFCMANNLGIKKSRGECIAILNNDTEVDRRWLSESVKVIRRDDRIAAVGSKILLKDGRVQSTGHIEFPYHYWGDRTSLEIDTQRDNKIQPVSSISNCSALYRRRALEDAEFFDEDFNMYMEDVDICFRLRQKKWKVFYAPSSRVYHKLHGSGQDPKERMFYMERNRLLFVAKYFPEELQANIAGYGEISKLEPELFNELLMNVFNKITKHHGGDKAREVFSGLNKDIKKVHNYNQHILREERDIHLRQRDERLKDLNITARTQEDKIHQLHEEVKVRDSIIQERGKQLRDLDITARTQEDKIRHLHEEVRIGDDHIKSLQGIISERNSQINEREGKIREFSIKLPIQEDKIHQLHEEVKARDSHIKIHQDALKDREANIARLNEDLISNKEALSTRTKQVYDLVEQINNLKHESESLQGIISEKDSQINEREGKIREFSIKLPIQEDKIHQLHEEVEARDDHIKSLQGIINEREGMIRDFSIKLPIQEDKIHQLHEEVKVRDDKINAKDRIIQERDIQLRQRDEQLKDLDITARTQEDKIRQLHEEVKVRDDKINAKDRIIQERDIQLRQRNKQLKDLDITARTQEDKIHQLHEEVKVRDDKINAKDRIIQERDIQLRQRDEQLKDLDITARTQEDKIRQLHEEVKVRDDKINAKDRIIQERDIQLRQRDEQLKDLGMTARTQEGKIYQLHEEARVKDNKINAQEGAIQSKDSIIQERNKQLFDFNRELISKGGQVIHQKEVIDRINNELLSIYNSKTYKFIVCPVIWPFLSFVKSLGRPFLRFSKKYINVKKNKTSSTSISSSIAQLRSNKAIARYMHENEYSVKLINTGFKEGTVKLLIDIWPYFEKSHPKRHYAYFATEIFMKSKDSVTIKVLYDWDKKMLFSIDGQNMDIIDYWRGEMISQELYTLEALILSPQDDNIISRLCIVQKLKK